MPATTHYVRRAVEGEHDGLAWVVERFSPFVEAQVRIRLGGRGSPSDVEDLVADVWTVALRRMADLAERDGRVTPVLVRFLGSTTLRCCNNHLRRLIHRARGQSLDGEDPAARRSSESHGVVTRLAERELARRVRECLERMGPEKRQVLVLRLLEQRTNVEIAAILGLQPNTVAVRYRRALTELRESLPREVYRDVASALGHGA